MTGHVYLAFMHVVCRMTYVAKQSQHSLNALIRIKLPNMMLIRCWPR
jgi:hypothetical protein